MTHDALELVSAILKLLRYRSARDDSSALIQSTSALLASLGARISIKSGRGRLSSMNNLTEKILRNCPCEYAAWPPSCHSPTCQRPAIRPFPNFESIAWYAANSEVCPHSRSLVVFLLWKTARVRADKGMLCSISRTQHSRSSRCGV
jgi:hypothetical protein